MSETFERIRCLVENGEIRISVHGYDEAVNDGIPIREIVTSVVRAVVVEDYPTYQKGPCVLVLQEDSKGDPIHVVWGIPRNAASPAVIVTAYRPDPDLWTDDFLRRKR